MDIAQTFYAIIAFVVIGVSLAAMILITKARLVGSAVCKVGINDDPEQAITTEIGTNLLTVLTGHGIPVPSPCGGKATCKQCKVQVLEGGGPLLQTEKDTFHKKQLDAGWRLACQCKVKQDMALHVEEHLLSVKEFDCKVLSNESVATFIKELIVEAPEEVPYLAGGYFQFHVPPYHTNTRDWKETTDKQYWEDWETCEMFGVDIDNTHLSEEFIRAYSTASYPAEGIKLIFNVRIATSPFVEGKLSSKIPWGICSSYVFGLKSGDTVRLSGPYGESFMINDDRELVFLIGGAGSSFGRSHIMHLFRTENTKRKASLWYGARSGRENIYEEEYRQLDKEFENFSYRLVLSEPLPEDLEAGWPKDDPIQTNFLFRAFEQGQLKRMEEPEEALYYVCGPPMHNVSVLQLLDDYGVPRENIVLDDFGI